MDGVEEESIMAKKFRFFKRNPALMVLAIISLPVIGLQIWSMVDSGTFNAGPILFTMAVLAAIAILIVTVKGAASKKDFDLDNFLLLLLGASGTIALLMTLGDFAPSIGAFSVVAPSVSDLPFSTSTFWTIFGVTALLFLATTEEGQKIQKKIVR